MVRFDEFGYASPWMDAVHEVYRKVDEARDVGYYSLYGREATAVPAAEIQEVLLHAAVYCGAPAAIDSFRTAKEVFKEMGI